MKIKCDLKKKKKSLVQMFRTVVNLSYFFMLELDVIYEL